jgi:predicted O-linked N-acetylglucosamine transferase (SPINDLY family)
VSKSRFKAKAERRAFGREPRAPQAAPAASGDVAALFAEALGLHQSGRLAEAEPLYRRILGIEPRHFDALHLLGVIHHQRGEHIAAIRQIDAALRINPAAATAHNNRGVALAELERHGEAVESYDRAIGLAPDYVDARFNRGNALKELGQFDAALASYDGVLALAPDHAVAFAKRGNVLSALGRFDEAVESYARATALQPGYSEAFNNRGVALVKLGRFAEAMESYQLAIAIRPDDAEALSNRGLALAELARYEDALASYDKAIALDPSGAEPFNNRGLALAELGRFEDALASYDRAIALRPDYHEAFNSRGVALAELRRFGEALESYDRAIAHKPDSPEAFSNRGNALGELARNEEALASYQRAIALEPDSVEALYNLGNTLHRLKRLDEALASYDRAIAANPDFAEAFSRADAVRDVRKQTEEAPDGSGRANKLKLYYADVFNNRGNVLREAKRLDEALASYRQAVTLRPGHAEYVNNRAIALSDLKRFDEALASYAEAVALKPDYAEAYNNRAFALRDMKRPDEALASFAQAVACKPDLDYLKGGYLHAKMHVCEWTDFAADCAGLEAAVMSGAAAASPFQLFATPAGPECQLRCARRYRADQYYGGAPLWQGERYAHRRIRLAYLSADLRDHPVAHLTAGMFERHDRTRFETVAISFKSDTHNQVRERLSACFERFIDAEQMGDRKIAHLVRELEIDIAVDLNGFTEGSRSDVFAQRPAPVQVNYLGFAGTLGQPFWDYIIADPFVVPQDRHAQYAEKVVYLPDTFMATDAGHEIPEQTPSRAQAGLPDSGLVFCCFNNSFKITPDVFDVWMRLLKKITGSVLWLSAANAGAVERLRQEAQRRGVAPDRLVFAPRLPRNEDHLARLRLADLFFDTLYYNAHTTASDALWAGVPVLTCSGATFASRVAGSLLHAVGLPELVTGSLADYEALALELARDPALLASLRQKLARNREGYPLFDTDRFTRHIEAAYTTMWERYQRSEPPESFAVTPIGTVRR